MKYEIIDVHTALEIVFKNFKWALLIGILLLPLGVGAVILVLLPFQSILIYNKNKRYLIDMQTGKITFPRSDVENSIVAVLLCAPYWNLMRSRTVTADQIEDMRLEKKEVKSANIFKIFLAVIKFFRMSSKNAKTARLGRRINDIQTRYYLYVFGSFGSTGLYFYDKQKRDEVRSAIREWVLKFSAKNIDRNLF